MSLNGKTCCASNRTARVCPELYADVACDCIDCCPRLNPLIFKRVFRVLFLLGTCQLVWIHHQEVAVWGIEGITELGSRDEGAINNALIQLEVSLPATACDTLKASQCSLCGISPGSPSRLYALNYVDPLRPKPSKTHWVLLCYRVRSFESGSLSKGFAVTGSHVVLESLEVVEA
eukprot:2112363-Amphidinium_carterae.2